MPPAAPDGPGGHVGEEGQQQDERQPDVRRDRDSVRIPEGKVVGRGHRDCQCGHDRCQCEAHDDR